MSKHEQMNIKTHLDNSKIHIKQTLISQISKICIVKKKTSTAEMKTETESNILTTETALQRKTVTYFNLHYLFCSV